MTYWNILPVSSACIPVRVPSLSYVLPLARLHSNASPSWNDGQNSFLTSFWLQTCCCWSKILYPSLSYIFWSWFFWHDEPPHVHLIRLCWKPAQWKKRLMIRIYAQFRSDFLYQRLIIISIVMLPFILISEVSKSLKGILLSWFDPGQPSLLPIQVYYQREKNIELTFYG